MITTQALLNATQTLSFRLRNFIREISRLRSKWPKVSAILIIEGEIIITALIEKGWHTYSQRPTDAGPISTIISFPTSKQYTLIGKTEESNAHEEFDKAFEAMLFTFTDKAEFNQKIKFTKAGFTITGKINRKDFGLNWNAALETGGVMVSEEVRLAAEIQLVKG